MRTFGFLTVLFIMAFLIVADGCAYFIRYDGPYEGKVVDADTGKAIEGVVVLGVWYKEEPNVAGSSSTFYDAKEIVTDKNGEFRIEGLGLKMFSYVGMMRFMIFKAGYMHLYGPWESLKESDYYRKMVQWEGEKVIVPLRKITMEERKKKGTPDFYIGVRYDERENIHHPCLPRNVKLLPEEVNKELKEQGREPYDLEEGRCDQ